MASEAQKSYDRNEWRPQIILSLSLLSSLLFIVRSYILWPTEQIRLYFEHYGSDFQIGLGDLDVHFPCIPMEIGY